MRVLIWLVFSSMFFSTTNYADEFVGQWHLYSANNQLVAQTIDGNNTLRIKVDKNQTVTIVFILNGFANFANRDNIFEYSSPTYGLIRTENFVVDQHKILIENHYEVNRFIENLKDISSHLMFKQHNMGNSFKDRKISITYLNKNIKPTIKRTAFSTIEIDEVLEKLGIS